MFNKAMFASAILALSATVVKAQTDDQQQKYSDWAGALNLFRYDWMPYEVKTEDGYTLTLMNITKKHSAWRVKAKLNPIIVQGIPGMQPDYAIESNMNLSNGLPADYPIPFKLLDAGHDLWYIYNRGGTYSQKHHTLSVYDADFWNFTFEELGRYDLKAAMDFVYTKTGKKTGIFATQAGNTVAVSGITSDYEWFKERTYKIVMMEPCTIFVPAVTEYINAKKMATYEAMDVFEEGGPTWYKTASKLVQIEGGLEGFRAMLYGGIGSAIKGMPIKLMEHLAQNSKMNRFQRYSKNFWGSSGGEQTDLYDLSLIKDIPVGMFMDKDDKSCSMAQNDITKKQIGAMVQMYKTYAIPEKVNWVTYNGKELNDDLVNFMSEKFKPNALPATFLQ